MKSAGRAAPVRHQIKCLVSPLSRPKALPLCVTQTYATETWLNRSRLSVCVISMMMVVSSAHVHAAKVVIWSPEAECVHVKTHSVAVEKVPVSVEAPKAQRLKEKQRLKSAGPMQESDFVPRLLPDSQFSWLHHKSIENDDLCSCSHARQSVTCQRVTKTPTSSRDHLERLANCFDCSMMLI